jgi:protein-tyrosine phosphatase
MAATRSDVFPVTWITEHLGVGAAPMSHAALDSLRRQGVRAILNLCQEFTELHEIESAAGFEVYHLPIADEEAPDLAELEKALAWLDEATYLGRKVYIHCRHGIGRTGTVLNAYLLRRGLGHLLAWRKLLGLRSQPANFRQWRAVRRYAARPGGSPAPAHLEHRFQVDMRPFFRRLRAPAGAGGRRGGPERHGRGVRQNARTLLRDPAAPDPGGGGARQRRAWGGPVQRGPRQSHRPRHGAAPGRRALPLA